MELCVGPVLFNWNKEAFLRFYQSIADSPADTVYIGEVICTKREGLSVRDIEDIADSLSKRGKKVILSTPAIVAGREELGYIDALLALPYPVEANDMAVLNMADGTQKEVIAGPHLEVYNHMAVEFLMSRGIKRVVFPVELPADSIRHIIDKTGILGELIVHGRVPLAFSWRCYTLRTQGLKRKHCKNQCSQWPEGMEIKTLDGERVFNINGTSILSARVIALAELANQIRQIPVGALRIYPHPSHTPRTLEIYKNTFQNGLLPEDAIRELERLYGGEQFVNGWFLGRAGKDYYGISKIQEVIQW